MQHVKCRIISCRQAEHHHEPVLISVLVQGTVRLLKASLPSAIEVHQDIHISPNVGMGMALANPSQIRQLLMNLCINAVQAMRKIVRGRVGRPKMASEARF
jgi:signal transduction histidine kinase